MKRKHIILITCLTIIVLANIKPTHYIFSFFLDEGLYRYSNSSGSFIRTEIKSYDFEGVKYNYSVFKKENRIEKDTTLYRLFRKNPLCFWRWYSYFSDERYDLPYKNSVEIRKWKKI